MDRFSYFGLLLGCLAVTVPLEYIYGFRVWRNPKRLVRALWPGFIVFVAWDLAAVERGHWSFSERYTSGWTVPGGTPVEEFLFFLVVPAAGISGFEAVRAGLAKRQARA